MNFVFFCPYQKICLCIIYVILLIYIVPLSRQRLIPMDNLNSSLMLLVGTILDNRYRIERHLASGGFGNTYMAVDTRFNSRVAVKEFFMRGTNHRAEDQSSVVVSNAANQEGFDTQLDKFRREAKRIFNMRHDHIVHVSDLFDANGTSYYVMDLIDGESLKDRMKQHPLTEAEVRDVADQLLDALDAVHKAGFFHLDVKPGNIMIDSKGHCTLIDFGASKQMSAMERTSLSVSGMAYTPGYAPIEQEGQRTKSIGPWTDFYAVGATLYNLLTGQTPPELDPDDTADDSRMFDYPDGVSLQMQRAISRMMNPSPRKRPQNVEEMRAALSDVPNNIETSSDETVASPVTAYVPVRTGETSQETQIYTSDTHAVDEEAPSSNKKKLWIVIGAIAACLAVSTFFLLRLSGSSSRADSSLAQNGTNTTGETTNIDPNIDRTYNVNGVEFSMKAVEGGTFTMGATSEQKYEDLKDFIEGYGDDEHPAHEVTLSGFSIGETEVTQALWQAVMGSNPSYFKGDGNLPVDSVSWDDCQTFIRKLNAATVDQRPDGREFRVPTEAEWEFAARGGNKSNHTQYAGGSSLSSMAWYDENSGDKTHPVAQKLPNELGLFDMSGNVWEWCQDWYDGNYYSRSPSTNPCNNTQASFRVVRGGGWGHDAGGCRVAIRYGIEPDLRSIILGLRLAL